MLATSFKAVSKPLRLFFSCCLHLPPTTLFLLSQQPHVPLAQSGRKKRLKRLGPTRRRTRKRPLREPRRASSEITPPADTQRLAFCSPLASSVSRCSCHTESFASSSAEAKSRAPGPRKYSGRDPRAARLHQRLATAGPHLAPALSATFITCMTAPSTRGFRPRTSCWTGRTAFATRRRHPSRAGLPHRTFLKRRCVLRCSGASPRIGLGAEQRVLSHGRTFASICFAIATRMESSRW